MSLPPDPDFKHSEQSVSAGFKKTLRKTLLDIRKNMTADEHVRFDHEIGRQVSLYLRSRMFKTIGVYLPIRNEPDLLELYQELSAKMHLSLPVTIDKDQPLQFVRWKPGDPLVKGDYNVSIPAMQEPVDMPEVLLIPCVGYTVNRFRLGYGGGFFDRTLADHPDTHTIGIAYSCLLTDFPTEENDIPLRCIITETGIML